MTRFIIHRLISSIPVLFGIVTAVFVLARVIPGNPCLAALGERATEEACAEFAAREGLDQPIIVQYVKYLGNVLTGDFGESFSQRRSVAEIMIERLPTTIELSIVALTFAIVVGVPLGVLAAYRRNTAVDSGTMIAANAGVSIPVFVLGLLLSYLFSVILKDTWLALPPGNRLSPGLVPTPFYEQWGLSGNGVLEFISNFEMLNGLLQWNWQLVVDAGQHLILPAIAVGTIPLAIIARMTRSSVVDVLGHDYVRTARAKGLKEKVVVRRHALRSGLLPVVTVIGLSLGGLFGGAILTESVFSLTGVGKTLRDSIDARDYSVVQGFSLIVGMAFVIVNLITDILYTVFDPRVRVCVTTELDVGPSGAAVPGGAVAVASGGGAPAPVASSSRWGDVLRLVVRSSSGRIGLILATIIIGMAILAPILAPYDPNEVLLSPEHGQVKEKPCVHLFGCPEEQAQHLMGLDENGRDEFSRIVYGSRVSLLAGGAAVVLAVLVGTVIGLISGFYSRRLDNVLMRCMDVLLSFPSLLLAILIVTVLGPGLVNSVLAISIVSVPIYARVVRGQVLSLREQDFVTADRALGVTNARILRHRVFPNALTPLVVQATLGFATAVIEIAGLGFLGLGVRPPQAEWGTMIAQAYRSILNAPHLVLFPGIFIFLNVLAFNLLGDALRDALDPRSERRA